MTSAIVPPSDGHEWMPVVGYSDVLSAAPGERIRFMVSTTAAEWDARFVRLIHGDEDAAGPGFKAEPAGLPGGRFPGKRQPLPLG
jgi:N,N-dimethylformamidase